MSIDELYALEPRLKELVDETYKFRSKSEWQKFQILGDQFKPLMKKLIGFYREEQGDNRLFTPWAYERAYKAILDGLHV
jgi:hypothetical protein